MIMELTSITGLKGEVSIPGDKSISHRSVMFASLANGMTEIHNFLSGADCLATIDCFRKMGIKIEEHQNRILVHGRGLHGLTAPSETLQVKNSGTTTRLLSGILAGQPFSTSLSGDESLNSRPMKRIIEPLTQMGAHISSLHGNGCAPLVIEPGKLHGIHYTSPVASAQVKSCILLALASFGVAVNESAFGTSSIALSKNNLFGHNAVDSDPGLANGYSSPQNSILDHDKYYVNLWYSTPKYSTYHGAFLGDKASGMNVSYASDPYWGESAAHWMWQLDEYVSGKSDAGSKKLVFKDQGAINIRKEATTSSASLYTTPKNGNMSFNILGKVKGESVSGSTDWYKIQLDVPLNSARTAIDYSGNSYNFGNSYGYVHSSLLSENGYTSDSSGGSDSSNSSTAYKLGDVNNDGKITPADYVKVKNHIMKKSTLSGKSLTAADVNKDGKITPADYVKIKNHIMGKSTIKE